MTLTTWGLLVCGALVYACWRTEDLDVFPGLFAVLFGFFLANSQAGPHITTGIQELLVWVGTWKL